VKWRHISMVAIRSPFCRSRTIIVEVMMMMMHLCPQKLWAELSVSQRFVSTLNHMRIMWRYLALSMIGWRMSAHFDHAWFPWKTWRKSLSATILSVFTARRNAGIASTVLATAIPSVCPSVTRRFCVKTTARNTVQFALTDSKMCLVL